MFPPHKMSLFLFVGIVLCKLTGSFFCHHFHELPNRWAGIVAAYIVQWIVYELQQSTMSRTNFVTLTITLSFCLIYEMFFYCTDISIVTLTYMAWWYSCIYSVNITPPMQIAFLTRRPTFSHTFCQADE